MDYAISIEVDTYKMDCFLVLTFPFSCPGTTRSHPDLGHGPVKRSSRHCQIRRREQAEGGLRGTCQTHDQVTRAAASR